jgi:uncharacterized membrane protein YqaE (UPF0057 family)
MVEVADGGREGMFLHLSLVEVLLPECLLIEPPLGLVLTRGVLTRALALNVVVVALASLYLALYLRIVGMK